MRREGFLKLAAGVVLAPYLAKIPSGAPKVVAPAATELTTSGAYFRAGDIVRVCSTGEALRVTSVDRSKITVTRGIGSVPASELAADAELVIVGDAHATGARFPDDFGFDGTPGRPRVAKVA